MLVLPVGEAGRSTRPACPLCRFPLKVGPCLSISAVTVASFVGTTPFGVITLSVLASAAIRGSTGSRKRESYAHQRRGVEHVYARK